jgi:hypothetical protein
MLDQFFYLSTSADVVDLMVIAIGIIALAVSAIWSRFTGSRSPSLEEISTEAERYWQRHGDAAISRIGDEMHRERVANGISARYRYLREISGHLCSVQKSAGNFTHDTHRQSSAS